VDIGKVIEIGEREIETPKLPERRTEPQAPVKTPEREKEPA
jgi:hypothetical protein